jgi:cell division protein FtsA
MSKEPIVVGLDIGTYWTKIAVARRLRDEQNPSVLALGVEPTAGVRKGVVVDINDTVHSITEAFDIASKMVEDDIHSVVLAIDGAHLTARRVRGKVAVSRADGEVTEEDVDRVLKAAEQSPTSANRRIIEMMKVGLPFGVWGLSWYWLVDR